MAARSSLLRFGAAEYNTILLLHHLSIQRKKKQIDGIHTIIHTKKGTGHGKRPDCCHFTQLKDQTLPSLLTSLKDSDD
jgi:hypothetical protein